MFVENGMRTSIMASKRRRRARPWLSLVVTLAFSTSVGCHSVGDATNDYFDWGGRNFTSNPGSLIPYYLGFGVFFVAGLPLDIFSWIATGIGWSGGEGDAYRSCALAPSILLGTSGGILLGAPFFPFGLPWWDPESATQDQPPRRDGSATPDSSVPADPSVPLDPKDPGNMPAGGGAR
jgi:hypothetical protein